MIKKIDTGKLSTMIRSKRGDKGLREVSKEIGVSAPTLSRIEQGKVPDVQTFMRICEWLDVSADEFSHQKRTEVISNRKAIVAHLRADKELDPDTVNMLVKMIDLAYLKKVDKGERRKK
jgi:transcriptional regulator with XRE-family HTH domain